MVSNRSEHTLVRIEDLNSSDLAGFPYRHLSSFLALLWPKCDSLAGNARMTQCGELVPLDDYGLSCGALLAIAISFLSDFSLARASIFVVCAAGGGRIDQWLYAAFQ
jgi:hypothetical protein